MRMDEWGPSTPPGQVDDLVVTGTSPWVDASWYSTLNGAFAKARSKEQGVPIYWPAGNYVYDAPGDWDLSTPANFQLFGQGMSSRLKPAAGLAGGYLLNVYQSGTSGGYRNNIRIHDMMVDVRNVNCNGLDISDGLGHDLHGPMVYVDHVYFMCNASLTGWLVRYKGVGANIENNIFQSTNAANMAAIMLGGAAGGAVHALNIVHNQFDRFDKAITTMPGLSCGVSKTAIERNFFDYCIHSIYFDESTLVWNLGIVANTFELYGAPEPVGIDEIYLHGNTANEQSHCHSVTIARNNFTGLVDGTHAIDLAGVNGVRIEDYFAKSRGAVVVPEAGNVLKVSGAHVHNLYLGPLASPASQPVRAEITGWTKSLFAVNSVYVPQHSLDVRQMTKTLLEEIVVGAGGQTLLDFTSIPQQYGSLEVEIYGRSEEAADYSSVIVRINGITATHYDSQYKFEYGETDYVVMTTIDQTYGGCGRVCGASAVATEQGHLLVRIPAYARSGMRRAMLWENTYKASDETAIDPGDDLWRINGQIRYRGTDAITRLIFYVNAGGSDWAEGTVARLWGLP